MRHRFGNDVFCHRGRDQEVEDRLVIHKNGHVGDHLCLARTDPVEEVFSQFIVFVQVAGQNEEVQAVVDTRLGRLHTFRRKNAVELFGKSQLLFDRPRGHNAACKEADVGRFFKQRFDLGDIRRVALRQGVKHQFHRIDETARHLDQNDVRALRRHTCPRKQVDQRHRQLRRRFDFVIRTGVERAAHQLFEFREPCRTRAFVTAVQTDPQITQRVEDVLGTPVFQTLARQHQIIWQTTFVQHAFDRRQFFVELEFDRAEILQLVGIRKIHRGFGDADEFVGRHNLDGFVRQIVELLRLDRLASLHAGRQLIEFLKDLLKIVDQRFQRIVASRRGGVRSFGLGFGLIPAQISRFQFLKAFDQAAQVRQGAAFAFLGLKGLKGFHPLGQVKLFTCVAKAGRLRERAFGQFLAVRYIADQRQVIDGRNHHVRKDFQIDRIIQQARQAASCTACVLCRRFGLFRFRRGLRFGFRLGCGFRLRKLFFAAVPVIIVEKVVVIAVARGIRQIIKAGHRCKHRIVGRIDCRRCILFRRILSFGLCHCFRRSFI